MFLTIFFILITFLAVFIVYDEFSGKVESAATKRGEATRIVQTMPNVFFSLLSLGILIIVFSCLHSFFKYNNMLGLPVFIGIVCTILAISYVILPAIYKPQ